MNRTPGLRIGILDLASPGWTAGATFSGVIAHSLALVATKEVELRVISGRADAPHPVPSLRPRQARAWRGEQHLRAWLRLPDRSGAFATAEREGLSVVLPAISIPPRTGRVKVIGWIPDFQHRYLPEHFSAAEIRGRDRQFEQLAARSDRVLLSSEAARDDFAALLPHHVEKARVFPFPSLLAFGITSTPVAEVLRRYRLPERYALVANQFWAHKNHTVVVEAVGQLARVGLRVPVVMTGMPADHRDPRNSAVSALLQTISRRGLRDQVVLLGEVPREELIALLRGAAVVIQPSRFEGWSTLVQDAKALARPLLCSDLKVHREQAPNALGFFGCHRPEMLAQLLEEHWIALPPGPNIEREEAALAREREHARSYGAGLLRLCEEVLGWTSVPARERA